MNYICAIIKNEHEYIREWVIHNKALGFDKIVLYDNNSTKPYGEALGDFIAGGFVTVKEWNTESPNRQIAAYDDFAKSGGWADDDWCAFIDPDEYIHFKADKDISAFLKRYTKAAAVMLFWKCYGANGRVGKPAGLSTTEAYPKKGYWNNPGFMFKTIAKLNCIGSYYDAHRIVPKGAGLTVRTNGLPFSCPHQKPDYAFAHIKHYITRSWEDFLQKLKRRNITNQRDIDMFFKVNPDMEHLRGELVKDLSTVGRQRGAELYNTSNAGIASGGRLYLGSPPAGMKAESINRRQAEAQKSKTEILNTIRQTDFKYYCSVCLIIRDENEYLGEWLNWHIGQGVQHFYIYDHGSKQPVKDFVQSLGVETARKITVIDWSGPHENAQPDAYNDCLRRFSEESRWIGFIDADEHVRVKTGQTLPEFLKEYEEFAGVFAAWVIYGANGQKKKADMPLRQRFVRAGDQNKRESKVGKVFVQALCMQDMVIHNGCPVRGLDIVGEGKDIIPGYVIMKKNASAELICVDHFYTKSYEEWIEKLRRGSGHADYARKYGDFFRYNSEMEYCREKIDVVQRYGVSDK